jgi:hypothetical protein
MIRRLEGWEQRLSEHLDAYRSEPFTYGTHDCATLAVGAVKALDPDFEWPITWTNEAEALRVIAAADGLESLATASLGEPIDNWRLCRRGDIALVVNGNWPSFAVGTASGLCAPALEGGIAFLPLDAAIKVWRVG